MGEVLSEVAPQVDTETYLQQLYKLGCANDERAASRDEMMFNITPSTGRFLELLICDARPKAVLELGTSNGYSTIWIGRAALKIDATVASVEQSVAKCRDAKKNVAACDLSRAVTIHQADCGDFLRNTRDDAYDFIFLDTDRSQYIRWLPDLTRVLKFGLMVVDNATSHPEEIAGFRRCLSNDPSLSVSVLPIGKGQMIVQASH